MAATIASGALLAYERHIDPDTFGLASSAIAPAEKWEGQTFTAQTIPTIMRIVGEHEHLAFDKSKEGCAPYFILWLGNSQLHFINQYQREEHVAPFWLRTATACPNTVIPLGISLANANFQEHYVLERYVTRNLPIGMVLLELCFDDLREDGLRPEFAPLLSAERKAIGEEAVARDIVDRAELEWRNAHPDDENSGLTGFGQKNLEDRLDSALGTVWPLWMHRGDLRLDVLTDLYFTRNALLGIKATTMRKLIVPRYEKNMRALEALLQDARQRGVAVVTYIAPIRQDFPIPYDRDEYERWKVAVEDLTRKNGASLVNLETLVPANLWGSYRGQDVDFMHFRGKGHEMLAQALLPYVEAARAAR